MSDYRTFIMTARGGKKKKGKSGDAAKRSRLLKLVMPYLSSDTGKALASAVEAKDLEKFKEVWSGVTSKIITKLEEEFKDAKPKEAPPAKDAKVNPAVESNKDGSPGI